MRNLSRRQTKWALLFLASVAGLLYISPVWLWTMPLWIIAMIICTVRGELWEAEYEDR